MNELRISGPRRAVEAFLEAAESVTEEGKKLALSFQRLYPTPQELLDTMAGCYGGGSDDAIAKQAALEAKQAENIARFGFKDWYSWRTQLWGTKWDVSEDLEWQVIGDEHHLEAVVGFDTAWAPPEGVLRHIAPAHPEVLFHLDFAEPGVGFGGVLELKGEEELECWTGEYSESPLAFPLDDDEEEEASEGNQQVAAQATEGPSLTPTEHGAIQ